MNFLYKWFIGKFQTEDIEANFDIGLGRVFILTGFVIVPLTYIDEFWVMPIAFIITGIALFAVARLSILDKQNR